MRLADVFEHRDRPEARQGALSRPLEEASILRVLFDHTQAATGFISTHRAARHTHSKHGAGSSVYLCMILGQYQSIETV